MEETLARERLHASFISAKANPQLAEHQSACAFSVHRFVNVLADCI
jgi:hypothetical protein